MNDAIPRPQAKTRKALTPLLEIRNLTKSYDGQHAVDDVSLTIYKGEIFALLGASGCGKSTLLRMLAGFEQPSAGQIMLDGVDLSQVPPYLRPINMMFQSYALFPHMTVEQNIAFGLKQDKLPKAEIVSRVNEMLGLVHMQEFAKRKPHQLSGGQRQRVAIARALSMEPELLVADEPIASLDVSIQAQIINLLRHCNQEHGCSMLFIAHDLSMVEYLCDRVGVMYHGKLVEVAPTAELYANPQHPYTWALLSSLPQLAQRNTKLYSITGTPPSLYNKIVGDAFAPRNPYCLKIDTLVEPPMFQVSETHFAKTWLLDPRAPKIEKPEIIHDIHQKLIDAFNI